MARLIGILASALLLAGCSAQPQANAAATSPDTPAKASAHPTSGLAITDVTVKSGGKDHIFRTELAITPEQQARGMMFRTEMGDNEAMLFPSELPAPRSFWMKNTPLSLDIIFIGPDGTISNIAERTEPYSEKSNLSDGPTIAVLELRGGRSKELGIGPGDAVTWSIPDAVSDKSANLDE
ncbi:MAG: DUF192 domain-containing protein [Erythrobacter sp.]